MGVGVRIVTVNDRYIAWNPVDGPVQQILEGEFVIGDEGASKLSW